MARASAPNSRDGRLGSDVEDKSLNDLREIRTLDSRVEGEMSCANQWLHRTAGRR